MDGKLTAKNSSYFYGDLSVSFPVLFVIEDGGFTDMYDEGLFDSCVTLNKLLPATLRP